MMAAKETAELQNLLGDVDSARAISLQRLSPISAPRGLPRSTCSTGETTC